MDVAGHRDALMLGQGYLQAGMLDDSIATLSGLLELKEGELGRDGRPSAEQSLGLAYYRKGDLEKALFHTRNAADSGRLPIWWRAGMWRRLAAISFELGRHDDAAAYGEEWRKDHEAAWREYPEAGSFAPADVLALAKYWSHVDRKRALEYAEDALATTANGLDEATEQWIARLRAGDAPAVIPPMDRSWLRQPPPKLTETEVLRRLDVMREHREYVTQPGAPPQWRRYRVDERSTSVSLEPEPALPDPLVRFEPTRPALLPAVQTDEADDGKSHGTR